jgi:WD40 repeat protein
LITGSRDGHVKRISVENRAVDKDFGKVDYKGITRMMISAGDEKLLFGNDIGRLKWISSIDGELIKDFRLAHEREITGIVITADQKFFFTSSYEGVLKQWNYEDNTLVRNHGEITNMISSMSL